MMRDTEVDLDALVEIINRSDTHFLSPIGPAILAAAALDICSDSRSFARIFNLAHALVIRECVSLNEELQLIETYKRSDKSQRLYYRVTGKGWSIISPDMSQT